MGRGRICGPGHSSTKETYEVHSSFSTRTFDILNILIVFIEIYLLSFVSKFQITMKTILHLTLQSCVSDFVFKIRRIRLGFSFKKTKSSYAVFEHTTY